MDFAIMGQHLAASNQGLSLCSILNVVVESRKQSIVGVSKFMILDGLSVFVFCIASVRSLLQYKFFFRFFN